MPRAKKCAPRGHNDRVLRGGKAVECTICHDRFPCERADCGHRDCEWVRAGEVSLDSAAYRGSEPDGGTPLSILVPPDDSGNTAPIAGGS